jgi:protein-tyrosine phosphatase
VAGREVALAAGPFAAMPAGAFGLCLDPGAPNRGDAALRLDIPDFGLPEPAALRAALGSLLGAMAREPERLFFVGCRAGLGRTGTVIACLGAELGVAGDDPVAWVRAVHDPRAVETAAQEAFARGWPSLSPRA